VASGQLFLSRVSGQSGVVSADVKEAAQTCATESAIFGA